MFPFISFTFRTTHHSHLIICFPFSFGSEPSHYLTTWLSSCSVGIFPGSHHIIVKISIISQVSPLKSTHIMWYSEQGYFMLICFELISALYFIAPLNSCLYIQANLNSAFTFLPFTFRLSFCSLAFNSLLNFILCLFLFLPLFV